VKTSFTLCLLALGSAAAAHPHLAEGAVPRLRSGSISNDDYPASALRSRAEGAVTMRLAVGADGRVTGCTVESSSGNSALDSTSCSLAQRRFRFVPASDPKGHPKPGEATRTVRWSLPVAPAQNEPL
jgi:protein TonB